MNINRQISVCAVFNLCIYSTQPLVTFQDGRHAVLLDGSRFVDPQLFTLSDEPVRQAQRGEVSHV